MSDNDEKKLDNVDDTNKLKDKKEKPKKERVKKEKGKKTKSKTEPAEPEPAALAPEPETEPDSEPATPAPEPEPAEDKKDDAIPEEFAKIIKDFITDILTTFPELEENLDKNLRIVKDNDLETIKTTHNDELIVLHNHCKKVFPERFFDILYQNEDIFKEDSELNTEFLPGIDIKKLWHQDISEKTQTVIWKYLQLLLFITANNLGDNETNMFGNAADLFSAINEDELKTKLEETLGDMHKFFDQSGNDGDFDLSGVNLPDADEMHGHINDMMGGKIGLLAKEIAEEVSGDLNIDPENISSTDDVFKKLLKDPSKLMNLVKSIGGKLEDKIKSGDIKQSELLEEASDVMKKMKNMPGMKNMESLFKNMGMPVPPGMQGGGKVNMGAMENKLNANLKQAKMRERMLNKMQQKKQQQEQQVLLQQKIQEQQQLLQQQNNNKLLELSKQLQVLTREKAQGKDCDTELELISKQLEDLTNQQITTHTQNELMHKLQVQNNTNLGNADEELIKSIFSTGEEVEKSSRRTNNPKSDKGTKGNKKNKKKKPKN